jgi:hypothetical protein
VVVTEFAVVVVVVVVDVVVNVVSEAGILDRVILQ